MPWVRKEREGPSNLPSSSPSSKTGFHFSWYEETAVAKLQNYQFRILDEVFMSWLSLLVCFSTVYTVFLLNWVRSGKVRFVLYTILTKTSNRARGGHNLGAMVFQIVERNSPRSVTSMSQWRLTTGIAPLSPLSSPCDAKSDREKGCNFMAEMVETLIRSK